jgi:hypothetical protein
MIGKQLPYVLSSVSLHHRRTSIAAISVGSKVDSENERRVFGNFDSVLLGQIGSCARNNYVPKRSRRQQRYLFISVPHEQDMIQDETNGTGPMRPSTDGPHRSRRPRTNAWSRSPSGLHISTQDCLPCPIGHLFFFPTQKSACPQSST